jgi:hypothetical protein
MTDSKKSFIELTLLKAKGPASLARIQAMYNATILGNHPAETELTQEQDEEMCWHPLLGIKYRKVLEEKLRTLNEDNDE